MKSTTFALGVIAAIMSAVSAGNGTTPTCGVYQISDGQPQWVPCPSTSTTATCNIYQISDGQPQWKPCSTTPTPTPSPSSSQCLVQQISDGQPQYVPCGSTSIPLLTGATTSTTPAPVLNTSYVPPSPTHSASTSFTGAAPFAQPDFAAGGLLGLAIAMGYLVM